MPIPRLTTSSCCSFEILCPEGSAAGDRVEVELPTVHAASAEVDTLERVRAFVEGDDQGFMQKIEAFCVQHVSAFGERDEIRQSSAEGREYPLEYQEVRLWRGAGKGAGCMELGLGRGWEGNGGRAS